MEEKWEVIIDGASVLKTLAVLYMFRKIYKAITNVRRERYVIIAVNSAKKEKSSVKKEKVESN